MNNNATDSSENDEYRPEPQPWEQQPGEPLDRYRWFQLYYTHPRPRTFTGVTQLLALRPGSRLVSRAAKDWRWKERAAAADRRYAGSLALQFEWRSLLLGEIAYRNRFITLEDTSRALAGAAVGELDRVKARKLLGPLLRHQQGLLRLLEPKKRDREAEIDEEELKPLIWERASEIAMEDLQSILNKVYGVEQPEAGSDGRNAPEEDDHSETEPWHQQPGEPDNHFRLLQIYLSLMLLQSTAQVAVMAKFSAKSTLDKIARKWSWQARAAAFDAHLDDQPLARAELQNRLLLDKAFTAHLHGLLDTARALQTAEIGRLTRSRARNAFSALSRQHRNILQSILSQQDIVGGKITEERRKIRIAAIVEKEANRPGEELDPRELEMLERIYGKGDENE